MNKYHVYNALIQIYPNEDQEYNDPVFVKLGKRILDAVKGELKGSDTSIHASPNSKQSAWIDEIKASVDSFDLVKCIHSQIMKLRSKTEADIACSVKASQTAESVSLARWLRIEGDWYDAEAGPKDDPTPNAYPKYCTTCGWIDFAHTPDPFLLHPMVLKGQRRDIFVARRGLLVVTSYGLEVMEKLIPNEFDKGVAYVKGKQSAKDMFFWVRPKHHIGRFVAQGEKGEVCKKCGRPSEYRQTVKENECKYPSGPIVESFGKSDYNLAFIGASPSQALLDNCCKFAPTHWLAISGGLFAALYNLGLKGIAWPPDGPLMSIKKKEFAWEDKRRFSDAYPASSDKIMKHKISN